MNDGDEDSFLDSAALARAEAALGNLAADYPRWLDADLTRAQKCLSPPADAAGFYAILHDIKGQAGTFGYPLVSAIAQRLCQDIQSGNAQTSRLERGVTLIRQAVADGVTNDTGEVGRQMLASLD